MSSTLTVGANLTPVQTIWSRTLSLMLSLIMRQLQMTAGNKTQYSDRSECRVFKKAGIVSAANGADDSPGQDLCLVIDTTNSDLYIVSGWSDSTTYTVTKILD